MQCHHDGGSESVDLTLSRADHKHRTRSDSVDILNLFPLKSVIQNLALLRDQIRDGTNVAIGDGARQPQVRLKGDADLCSVVGHKLMQGLELDETISQTSSPILSEGAFDCLELVLW